MPLDHPKYPKLGLWVKEQRRHYTLLKQGKLSHLTIERTEVLDRFGFCWDTYEATWLERLRQLADFKEENGSCVVPSNYASNAQLATWVRHQRQQYKKFKGGKSCHITEERVRALDELEFSWQPRKKGSCSRPDDDSTISDESSSQSSSDDGDTEVDHANHDLRPSKRQRRG